ncbi:MAG: YdeI/OmpD-associated family protein [Ilumatobacteraceae bacterium]
MDNMASRMTKPATTVTFDTTIVGSATKTGIAVPSELIEQLQAGQRPGVEVQVNGYQYRSTVAVMSGQHLIGVSAEVRKAASLQLGDAVHVTLTLALSPRTIEVPADLAAALDTTPAARDFFKSLSNSLQRMHIDNVTGAKSLETRQRRIDKCIALFLEHKPR